MRAASRLDLNQAFFLMHGVFAGREGDFACLESKRDGGFGDRGLTKALASCECGEEADRKKEAFHICSLWAAFYLGLKSSRTTESEVGAKVRQVPELLF